MKITAKVFMKQESWQSKPDYLVSTGDMSNMGWEFVSKHEIEFNEPENFNAKAFQLRQLEKEKQKVIDKFHSEVAKINEEIQKYQCIEMTK